MPAASRESASCSPAPFVTAASPSLASPSLPSGLKPPSAPSSPGPSSPAPPSMSPPPCTASSSPAPPSVPAPACAAGAEGPEPPEQRRRPEQRAGAPAPRAGAATGREPRPSSAARTWRLSRARPLESPPPSIARRPPWCRHGGRHGARRSWVGRRLPRSRGASSEAMASAGAACWSGSRRGRSTLEGGRGGRGRRGGRGGSGVGSPAARDVRSCVLSRCRHRARVTLVARNARPARAREEAAGAADRAWLAGHSPFLHSTGCFSQAHPVFHSLFFHFTPVWLGRLPPEWMAQVPAGPQWAKILGQKIPAKFWPQPLSSQSRTPLHNPTPALLRAHCRPSPRLPTTVPRLPWTVPRLLRPRLSVSTQRTTTQRRW